MCSLTMSQGVSLDEEENYTCHCPTRSVSPEAYYCRSSLSCRLPFCKI